MVPTAIALALVAAPPELAVVRPGTIAYTSARSDVHAFVTGDVPNVFARIEEAKGRVRVRTVDVTPYATCFTGPAFVEHVELDAWVDSAALAPVSIARAEAVHGKLRAVLEPGAIVDGQVLTTSLGSFTPTAPAKSATSFQPSARPPGPQLHVKGDALDDAPLAWPTHTLVKGAERIGYVTLDGARVDDNGDLAFALGCVSATLHRTDGFAGAVLDISKASALKMRGKDATLAKGAALFWPDGTRAGRVRNEHVAPSSFAERDGLHCARFALDLPRAERDWTEAPMLCVKASGAPASAP